MFPLATPFLAGPGSIIAAVLLTENERFSFVEQSITGLIVVAICLFAYAVLASADVLQRQLGSTGTSVMSRVFGLVLSALAMQTLLEQKIDPAKDPQRAKDAVYKVLHPLRPGFKTTR